MDLSSWVTDPGRKPVLTIAPASASAKTIRITTPVDHGDLCPLRLKQAAARFKRTHNSADGSNARQTAYLRHWVMRVDRDCFAAVTRNCDDAWNRTVHLA